MRVFSVILIAVLLLLAVLSCDQNYHIEMQAGNNPDKFAAPETVPDEVGKAAGPVSATHVYKVTLVSVDATESVSKPVLTPAG